MGIITWSKLNVTVTDRNRLSLKVAEFDDASATGRVYSASVNKNNPDAISILKAKLKSNILADRAATANGVLESARIDMVDFEAYINN